ncbi:MAG: HAD family hydrolase [Nocardioidaceae bacterium]
MTPHLPGLVIFDCDGVLVDSERLTVVVEARVLTALGWPMDAEEVVARWMGRSAAVQHADVLDRLGPDVTTMFEERTERELRAAFDRDLRPVPGVSDALDALDQRGVRTCVASSGSHDKMRLTLGRTGLWQRFAGRIFSADDVEHGKPAPDLFLHAAAATGVHPADCVVIEDSVYGVRAALAAGMTSYGYTGGLTDSDQLGAAGARLFATMADLADLLLRPAAR